MEGNPLNSPTRSPRWVWVLSHVCSPHPQSQPVLLHIVYYGVHNIICPFVRDFPLQIFIPPPPNASLFRLGLKQSPKCWVCQEDFQLGVRVDYKLPMMNGGTERWGATSPVVPLLHKAIDVFKGLAWAAWTIQACNPTRRKFHSSLGQNVFSCTVCPCTLRQRLWQVPEFHSKRIGVKALLMQLYLIQITPINTLVTSLCPPWFGGLVEFWYGQQSWHTCIGLCFQIWNTAFFRSGK